MTVSFQPPNAGHSRRDKTSPVAASSEFTITSWSRNYYRPTKAADCGVIGQRKPFRSSATLEWARSKPVSYSLAFTELCPFRSKIVVASWTLSIPAGCKVTGGPSAPPGSVGSVPWSPEQLEIAIASTRKVSVASSLRVSPLGVAGLFSSRSAPPTRQETGTQLPRFCELSRCVPWANLE